MTIITLDPAVIAGIAIECSTCQHADDHGWWGPEHRGTHCRGCHRSWEGTAEIHCVVCHRHFSSQETLEQHKDGVRCKDPSRCRREDGRPVFVTRESRYGETWTRAEERQPPRGSAESAASSN